jgi:hypothetical protein
MKLSEEQIEVLALFLQSGGIRDGALFDDLLDHLICATTIEMKRGKSFESAMQKSVEELAPNGLQDLEAQTRYLLNSKRIIIMKKLMYAIGFIGAASLSFGSLFKLMHWPGANIMLLSGIILFLLVFVPLWAIDRYKVEISKALSTRLKFIGGVTSAVLVGLSVIFKTLHLQGANVLLVLGVLTFVFAFLPFLFFSLYKKSA